MTKKNTITIDIASINTLAPEERVQLIRLMLRMNIKLVNTPWFMRFCEDNIAAIADYNKYKNKSPPLP